MTDDHQDPEVTNAQDRPSRGALDAPLVTAARAGDGAAFGKLYDRWFDRVHDLAYRILRDTEAAADVAQDAFLAAYRNLDNLQDTNAFGGWLLRIARNGALNRKRKDERAQPVDEARLAVIERVQARPEDQLASLDDPARVAEDAELAALLWESADALGERDREIIDLQLRHGLAPAEIADVVGLNRNAANQLVHRVRQRLAGAVEARVLWRGGAPSCAQLRAELEAAEVDAFGPDAVRLAVKHVAACARCEERKRTKLSPAAMFSALPIMVIPALKAKAAAALAAAGVPMDGSSFGPPHGTDGPHDDAGSRRLRPRRRRALMAGGALAVVVIAAVVAIGASTLGDGTAPHEVELAAADEPTSTVAPTDGSTAAPTTAAPATITAAPTTAARIATPPTTRRAGGANTTVAPVPTTTPPTTAAPTTTAPAPTTTTTPPPVTMGISINPKSMTQSYGMKGAPVLSWGVTNAAAVRLVGPNVDLTTMSGSLRLCPHVPSASNICDAPPGNYTYTLEAKSANGTLLGSRSATLTISGLTIP
jgi:RNA polymerase sigma factor (sigma-70 family)